MVTSHRYFKSATSAPSARITALLGMGRGQEVKNYLLAAKTSSSWQVLLVEDNRLAQMAVKNQLTALNCEVDWAENGRQALKQSATKGYDLIFLDIELPDFDGYEVARRIRQAAHNLNQQTPIIALTTHAGADNQHACLKAGMQRLLIKPLQPNQARQVLAKYAGISLKNK